MGKSYHAVSYEHGMLQAHAKGTRGQMVFLGFTPHDLAHLTSNQPISPDAKSIGIEGKPFVILFETDPMVEFYAAQPWIVTILFRQSTIDAMKKAPAGFVELPLRVPGVPENTTALLFFADDNDALVARLQKTGLVSPATSVVREPEPEPKPEPAPAPAPAKTPAPAPAKTPAPARRPVAPQLDRTKNWLTAIVCLAIALFCLYAAFAWHVKSVAGVLGGAALFGVAAVFMFYVLWRSRA
jgi:hypothetical protein